MIRIEEYILLPQTERQAHLKLNEPCIERGGIKQYSSVMCKGLLAHTLDTTIPFKLKIYACHACNNSECSNPSHLYWGTPAENIEDARACGKQDRKSIRERTIAKHGLEKANEFLVIAAHRGHVTIARRVASNKIHTEVIQNDARKISKRNSQFGTLWVKKDEQELKIKKEELGTFIDNGWRQGRTKAKFYTPVTQLD